MAAFTEAKRCCSLHRDSAAEDGLLFEGMTRAVMPLRLTAEAVVPKLFPRVDANTFSRELTQRLLKGEIVTICAKTDRLEALNGVAACWYKILLPGGAFGWVHGSELRLK